MIVRRVDWTQFKSFHTARNTDILYSYDDSYFYVHTAESGIQLYVELLKGDPNPTDTQDFVDNYQSLSNPLRRVYDSTGVPYGRLKIANEGNSLQCFAFTFTTASDGSLFSKESDNSTNETGNTYEMFDSNGDSTNTDANAVHTRVSIERPFDTEFIGGAIFQKSVPASDVVCYMTAAPDISVELGGSKVMCQGLNLAYLSGPGKYEMDGRAPLLMPYSATLHTNKLRLDVYHASGLQHDLMVRLEYYWS